MPEQLFDLDAYCERIGYAGPQPCPVCAMKGTLPAPDDCRMRPLRVPSPWACSCPNCDS
ncbi:MAG: hypothetical protein JOZ69_04605 [Myxococcales bacterium]|nr:hypothetical protein [Myxococcales bacterium]